MHKYIPQLGLLFVLFLMASCQENKQAAAPPAPQLEVVEVATKTVTGYQDFPANIQGKISNDVRAKIQGYIQKVYVDEGQRVTKGQALFQLEANTLTETANAAKSGIAVAESNVNVAQVEVDKLKPLVEKGIISSIQLETAKANLASAKSALAQAKANYQNANANLDYATVRSPINGVVGRIAFREGSLVGPADPAPLTNVAEISTVYAYFTMNEKQYIQFLGHLDGKTLSEKIKNIPAVKLRLADDSVYPHDGKVETISGQIDPVTGTVQFRASFPNPDNMLRNGSSGLVMLPRVYDNAIAVPSVATFEQQGKTLVYKVVNDTAISTIIEVKDKVDNTVVVSEGVQPGEQVVITGTGTLRNRTAIVPKKVNFDSVVQSINPVF